MRSRSYMVSLAARIHSRGNVRCPWYFLFAHAACAPNKPSWYVEIKHADWFANLENCETRNLWSGRKNLPPDLEKGDTIKGLPYSGTHVLDCVRSCCCAILELCHALVLLDKVEFAMILGIKITELAARLDKLL